MTILADVTIKFLGEISINFIKMTFLLFPRLLCMHSSKHILKWTLKFKEFLVQIQHVYSTYGRSLSSPDFLHKKL